jgi:hypothetical protein
LNAQAPLPLDDVLLLHGGNHQKLAVMEHIVTVCHVAGTLLCSGTAEE